MAECLAIHCSRLNISGQKSGKKLRKFIPNQDGMSIERQNNGQEFTIASFNVLSQNLLVRHPEMYAGSNPNHLTLNFRKQKIIEEIDRYLPDILCLQEVHKDDFKPFFCKNLSKRGYYGIYKQRPGSDNEDGCATFYKTNMFSLLNTKLIEYDLYDGNCPGKFNIAVLVALKFNSRADNAALCVANTHLLYNPCRGDIKMTQLMILLAEIDKMRSGYPHYIEQEDVYGSCPSILCGDLNLVPGSWLHRFLCEGKLDWTNARISSLSGLPLPEYSPRFGFCDSFLKDCLFIPRQIARNCRFKDGTFDHRLKTFRTGVYHNLNLISSYPHHDHHFITSSHSKASLNLDYILYTCMKKQVMNDDESFHSHPVVEGGLHLVEWLDLPQDLGRIPNEWNGSDHVMIVSKFIFF